MSENLFIKLPKFYNRIICTSQRIFNNVNYRIAVIADEVKAMAVLGALRGGLINSLVTSSKVAAKIIDLDDSNK